MNELGIAFEMMGVGMITVFVILSLVVLLGNLIIRFVNKYIPEVVTQKVQPATVKSGGINPQKMAAIVSAVKTVTGGKGHVSKIEKL
ncbi:MAG: OadG family protein [Mangrovibacterium sp.]